MDDDLIALTTAYVNHFDIQKHCTVSGVEVNGNLITIRYDYPRGSSEWHVNLIDLVAWAWNNPKP